MPVAAGSLRHRVQLQRPMTKQDPVTGEMKVRWVNVAQLWAEVVPMSAREFMAASAEQSEVRGRITIRRRSDIDATMRIIHRGMAYQILGVLADPVSGLEYQTLPVTEGVRVT